MSDYISKSALIEELRKGQEVIKDKLDDISISGIYATIEAVIEEIERQPTLNEKEIIRKYGEQILDAFYGKHAEYRRLSEQANIELPQECYYSGHTKGFEEAIKIIKEECGINE